MKVTKIDLTSAVKFCNSKGFYLIPTISTLDKKIYFECINLKKAPPTSTFVKTPYTNETKHKGYEENYVTLYKHLKNK